MASKQAIERQFAAMLVAGVPPPAAWTDDNGRSQAVTVWHRLCAEVEDDELGTAVGRWLASADARFWPLPGQVLAHLPPVAAPPPPRVPDWTDDNEPWPELDLSHADRPVRPLARVLAVVRQPIRAKAAHEAWLEQGKGAGGRRLFTRDRPPPATSYAWAVRYRLAGVERTTGEYDTVEDALAEVRRACKRAAAA